MKKYSFTVIIEKDEEAGVYVGEVPDLPACHSQGKTIDELMKNMREVIGLCIDVQKEHLLQLPKFVGLQQVEVSA
jgi:predicted RNase H-like HicB family nuclease